jgi:hypothetical protein
MTAQYAVVALAVLFALLYLGRTLIASWRAPSCSSGGCAGCSQSKLEKCASEQGLVPLRLPAPDKRRLP